MHWGYQINLIYINLFWLLRLWTWQSSHSRILFCHLKITNVKWVWSNTPFLNKCVIYFMQQVASWLLINRELYDSKFFIYDLKLLVRLMAFTMFGKIYKSFELSGINFCYSICHVYRAYFISYWIHWLDTFNLNHSCWDNRETKGNERSELVW